MDRRRVLLLLIALLILSALATACGSGGPRHMTPVPANLDTSTTRTSDQGLYRATIIPSLDPIPINQVHTWTLHVETTDGKAVDQAEITVDGGMPQHGHGLPTQPQVTKNLGNGNYLVEGMKFQMTGWWVVHFNISAGGQSDRVTFNLMLK